MIYIGGFVVRAWLLTEPRNIPAELWETPLVSSRLLAYEVWNRIHARDFTQRLRHQAEALLEHVDLIDLSPMVLDRALRPFPRPIKTLDALHLATAEYLRGRDQNIQLASFDSKMVEAARGLGIDIYRV